jgi:C4-dicarboxylate transporter, DctM subunit
VTKTIEGMLKAAVLPGLLLLALVSAWGIWRQPLVAVGPLFGGWVSSPVQAAAVTAFYALAVEALFHRDLRLWRDLPRIAAECGLLTGGILLILGSAMGLTNYLVTAKVPEQLTTWVSLHLQSPLLFLLALNIVLLIVGCLMEIYSAIVVVVLPVMLLPAVAVVLITYWPGITHWLPSVLPN